MKVLKKLRRDERLAQLSPAFFFWLVLVAVTATQTAPAGMELSWPRTLRRAMLSWTLWAMLTPLIISVDRKLPIARKDLLRRFSWQVPLSLLFTTIKQLLVSVATSLFFGPGPERSIDSLGASFKGTFQANFMAYWVVIFVYITFDYHHHLREQEIRQTELEKLVSQARVEALRAQLHPHFLFNALNTISAYVERSPRSSRRMLEELEELFRLSLAHAEAQEAPLTQEVAFIEHYLAIQKARFAEQLTAIVKADPDVGRALVPTFILQPLVENAVLYGIARPLKRGRVEVRVWRTNGQLHLKVQDDGPGLPPGWDGEHDVGIGISNTRERLRQLHGERGHSFQIASEPGKGVCVELSVLFH